MVGNHDWYYHLKGTAFDQIRQEIITAMGLSNPPSPFPSDLRKIDPASPWEVDESPDLERLFRQYKVFCRHGDLYDPFNFDMEKGRDQVTLGDAFAMELCNRYPEELKRRPDISLEVVNNLRHITNVRPALRLRFGSAGRSENSQPRTSLWIGAKLNLKKYGMTSPKTS